MVPLYEKRHRIYENEIPAIQEGLKLLLLKLFKTRENREMAEAACRVLFRIDKKNPGRPKYPEFSWENIPYFVSWFVPSKE